MVITVYLADLICEAKIQSKAGHSYLENPPFRGQGYRVSKEEAISRGARRGRGELRLISIGAGLSEMATLRRSKSLGDLLFLCDLCAKPNLICDMR
jgi:hypothetical protein